MKPEADVSENDKKLSNDDRFSQTKVAEENQNAIPNPLTLLSMDGIKVQTLTVSDQHATLLLTNKTEKEEEEIKSLLKLTLIPFHKIILGSNPFFVTSAEGSTNLQGREKRFDAGASKQIISFLQRYSFQLKSESGAEYSYYRAVTESKNFVHKTNDNESKEGDISESSHMSLASTLASFGSFDVELISPASDRQIFRAMPSVGSTLVEETPQLYNEVVKPYIASVLEGNSLSWIDNILEVKKEKERLLVNDPLFIVNIDTKWRSHPDPLMIPREKWKDHKAVSDLYCLGIVKDKSIASLRDLTSEHLPLLRSMLKEGYSAIERIYGVVQNQIRAFVHYQPQFYCFHVHFTRLENEIGSTVERGHLVSDIIQNLEIDSEYYSKRTITYKLKKMTPLYNLIMEQSKTNDKKE